MIRIELHADSVEELQKLLRALAGPETTPTPQTMTQAEWIKWATTAKVQAPEVPLKAMEEHVQDPEAVPVDDPPEEVVPPRHPKANKNKPHAGDFKLGGIGTRGAAAKAAAEAKANGRDLSKVVDIFPAGDDGKTAVPVDAMERDRLLVVAKLDDDKAAYTEEDCRVMMRALGRDRNVEVARALLAEFKADKASLVPAERRYEFIKRVEELRAQ
jgi:hypothetical protein